MGSKGKGKIKGAVGRQRQRVDRTGLSRVTERADRQTEMEVAGCDIFSHARPYDPSGQGTDITSQKVKDQFENLLLLDDY